MSEYIIVTLIPRELNGFPLILSGDSRPWNLISPHRIEHSQEWKERKKKNRFSKDVIAKISGRGKNVEACREVYFPGGSDKNSVLRCLPRPLQCYAWNRPKSIRPSDFSTSYDNQEL